MRLPILGFLLFAVAARAENVDAEVVGVDLHLGGVARFRQHLDQRE